MSLATVSTPSSAADQSAAGTWQVPRFVRRLIVPVSLLVIWQVLASYGIINRRFSSSPVDIIAALWKLAVNGQLFDSLWISLVRAFLGLALGGSLGLLAGLVAGLSRLGEDALDSTIQAIRTLPFLGLVPLFILWFGLGETPRILLVALGTFFPIYLNVFKGIRGVEERLIELGRSYGLNRWELIRDIILPAALPNALVGLRYSLGIAWLVLVIAEQINATSGLGWLIIKASELAQTSVIMMVLAVYALIGILADAIVRLIETRALRWQRSFQGA
ncbi:sulfonate transport system permease protein [Aquamicrobium lusatiense]|uniref:Sulfonate transport system permease protein n=1 Tax=Aquamicrobium lusatiense TaxID=89772 RepID=A0A7W9S4C2_9HYPH|nr:ABC transporter permease subunit [Aquamicrobium lusatiense]MBB6013852.1 sulfonate transport system permease protein [Aquamicrobium lusatiense]